MKVSYIITQNKFNAILNQETTEIKVSFKTGYYPISGGGGGDLSNYYTKDETYSKTEVDDIISDIPVVDTSNLVPYTGATQDVNIASNYFKTSKGFDFTFDENNYFRSFYTGYHNILEFKSKDDSDDEFGSILYLINPEEGFQLVKKNNNGLSLNSFSINNLETFSLKPFVSESGFKTTNGTSNQYLMADGSTSTLPTDLVKGTGTANYLPKFTASGTIGNSIIYENNNSVSIGDTVSDARLRVKAQGSNATDIVFRIRNSADTRNFLVVNGAGDVYNYGAGGESSNLFFGENSGRLATGIGNVGFGNQSLRLLSIGTYNSGFGYSVLSNLTTGSENTAFGQASLQLITTNNQNTAIGRASLSNLTSGNQLTALGVNSARFIADGVTALSSANLGVFLGYNTKASANGVTNEIVIGANATGNGSNTATIGNDSTTSVYLKGITNSNGFKTPTGTANQSLTANGGVFDLNTKADLDGGKVPAWQLPSYVDDVLEFANLASFPATGESGKIYIAIDTNLTYRWGGSSYVVMSSSLALGETSSTAYRGDRGKIAYEHSGLTGNPHDTELEQLTDVSGDATSIVDTDIILKKEVGGLWKKITFANFKNWFTTELAKKINIGLDTVFNFKNISAMTLTQFKALTPNLATIYFTEEQNSTGWQQIKYNGLGISIPATTETLVSLTNENYLELDSDSTFNLIDVVNTKINGIFEKDFVIIKFNAGVVTPATANQWFKVILKINGVQAAVSPVFYLTESSGTVEQIAHNFSLNVPAEMVTNGATLHLKTSVAMTFNNPAISVVRVHKSINANL